MPEPLDGIAAVLFDINCTLIHPIKPMRHVAALANSLGVDTGTLEAALNPMNESFDRGKVTPGRRLLVATAQMGIPLDHDRLTKLVVLEIGETGKGWGFYPGAVRMLRRLRQKGLKIGLCSNQNPIGKTIVRSMKLPEMADACVLSCDIGIVKPEPGIYRLALDGLGVSASQALFVGDGGSQEFVGAREIGMLTARVMHPDGYASSHPDAADTQADYEIRWIKDLSSFLQRTR